MDIAGKVVWQHAAGDMDRNYADLCLRWDMILNGPGYAGPWPDCEATLETDGTAARKITDIRRFAKEMKDGDVVVLRLGTHRVLGVGQVVGEYEWHDGFGDVDGWELQHVRRVRWLWKSHGSPKIFPTYALKQGDTTQRLSQGIVTEWLESIEISEESTSRPIVDLPIQDGNRDIDVDKISEFLFDRGVASSSINSLMNEIGELIRIAKWYQRSENPSEHETVAYLVVPILRALGWTPQKMAVEWNHVDVALFEQLPRSDENLRVVVEAKKMGNSCLSAMSQAMTYADKKVSCHRLIVTDGLRYGVYVRDKLETFSLYAYLNITRLKHDYPVYDCKGAEEALLAMAPEWRSKDT